MPVNTRFIYSENPNAETDKTHGAFYFSGRTMYICWNGEMIPISLIQEVETPLTITNNKLSIKNATINNVGVVKPDPSFNVNNGLLSLNQATNNLMGGFKTSDEITLNSDSTLNLDKVLEDIKLYKPSQGEDPSIDYTEQQLKSEVVQSIDNFNKNTVIYYNAPTDPKCDRAPIFGSNDNNKTISILNDTSDRSAEYSYIKMTNNYGYGEIKKLPEKINNLTWISRGDFEPAKLYSYYKTYTYVSPETDSSFNAYFIKANNSGAQESQFVTTEIINNEPSGYVTSSLPGLQYKNANGQLKTISLNTSNKTYNITDGIGGYIEENILFKIVYNNNFKESITFDKDIKFLPSITSSTGTYTVKLNYTNRSGAQISEYIMGSLHLQIGKCIIVLSDSTLYNTFSITKSSPKDTYSSQAGNVIVFQSVVKGNHWKKFPVNIVGSSEIDFDGYLITNQNSVSSGSTISIYSQDTSAGYLADYNGQTVLPNTLPFIVYYNQNKAQKQDTYTWTLKSGSSYKESSTVQVSLGDTVTGLDKKYPFKITTGDSEFLVSYQDIKLDPKTDRNYYIVSKNNSGGVGLNLTIENDFGSATSGKYVKSWITDVSAYAVKYSIADSYEIIQSSIKSDYPEDGFAFDGNTLYYYKLEE